jgi:hypothetical protein
MASVHLIKLDIAKYPDFPDFVLLTDTVSHGRAFLIAARLRYTAQIAIRHRTSQ